MNELRASWLNFTNIFISEFSETQIFSVILLPFYFARRKIYNNISLWAANNVQQFLAKLTERILAWKAVTFLSSQRYEMKLKHCGLIYFECTKRKRFIRVHDYRFFSLSLCLSERWIFLDYLLLLFSAWHFTALSHWSMRICWKMSKIVQMKYWAILGLTANAK